MRVNKVHLSGVLRQVGWDLTASFALLLVYWLASGYRPMQFPFTLIQATAGAALVLVVSGHTLRVALFGRTRFRSSSLGGKVTLDVLLSLLVFAVVSVGLSVTYLLDGFNVMMVLGSLTILSIIVAVARREPCGDLRLVKNSLSVLPVTIVAASGLIIALLFRWAFSWPSMPGWDVNYHLAVSNLIVAHDGMADIFPIVNGHLAYPHVFHVLVASFSNMAGISPYDVFWLAPFLSIPLYGVLVYSLSSALTKSRTQSVVAGVLAVAISGGDALLGPEYFFTSTAFILLFMLTLLVLVKSPLEGLPHLAVVGSALALCYLVYYFPFFLSLPVLALFLMLRYPDSFLSLHRRVVLTVLLAVTVLSSYLLTTALSFEVEPLAEKAAILGLTYPPVLWLLSLVGGLVVVRQFLKDRTGGFISLGMAATSVTLIAVCFLPFNTSTRSELLLRPLIAIVSSFIVVFLSAVVAGGARAVKGGSPLKSVGRIPGVLLAVFLVASVALVAQPYLSYASQVPSLSNISADEYAAGQWLSQNTPANGYILTDPSTGYVLRGLTLRNASNSFIFGDYVGPYGGYNLTSTIFGFFSELDLTRVAGYLEQLPQTPAFIVITTRTASWVLSGVNSSFGAPTGLALTSFSGSEKFSLPLFSLAASWDTVKVYRHTNAQLVTAWNATSSENGFDSWYLEGAYGSHRLDYADGSLMETVQAGGQGDAQTGATFLLGNLTQAEYLFVRYRIDSPAYSLELMLFYSDGSPLVITLKQSSGWQDAAFALSGSKDNPLVRVALVVWTRDTSVHTVEVNRFAVFSVVP